MSGSGGAWKVAYADFVTAMMALFMVLWISAQDKEILIATSEYFQNPFKSPMDASSGVMPFNNTKSTKKEKNADSSVDREKQVQMTFLSSVAADFHRLLHLDESLDSKPIDIRVTSDGLRVTLFDRANRPLFQPHSTAFTEWGTFVLQNLAWTIDRHGLKVTIDGHARASAEPDEEKPEYSKWELSADRANSARRQLVHYAVDPGQIERVTGYGDTKPPDGETAASESTDRLTLNLTLSAKNRFKNSKFVDNAVPMSPTPTNSH